GCAGLARLATGARFRDGTRHALSARRRVRALRHRSRAGRRAARLPALRALSPRLRALTLLDATFADDAERIQRMARLYGRRMGEGARLRARVAELRAVRGAAGARGAALRAAKARATCAAAAQGTLPARQPAALQPQVLPDLAATLRRVRTSARPSARGDRGACRRGVPP